MDPDSGESGTRDRCSPEKIAGPGEGEKGDGGDVMNEHLHKVFPLHVKELGDGEGPVEGEGEHVVPPHVRVQLVVGIVIPYTHTKHPRQKYARQCSESVAFWFGSGSSDPYL